MAAKSKRKQASQAPISSHPAFPAIVALWFAALFGIGSLVMPVMLVEKLVTVTGLSSLVPAAAPPLGVTARMLIALVAAGLGIVVGIILARRVASAQGGSERGESQAAPRRAPKLRTADSHPDAPAKRPISAREELGAEGLDEPFDASDMPRGEPIPGRRRPLSVTDERGRSEFLDAAPLPGLGEAFGPPASDEQLADDALELGSFADEDAHDPLAITMPLTNDQIRARDAGEEAAELPGTPDDAELAATAMAEADTDEPAGAAPFAPPQEGPIMAHDSPFAQPASFDAAEDDFRPFAAPAAPFEEAPVEEVEADVEEAIEPAAAPAPAFAPPMAAAAPAPAVDTATGPLADLTVAQLVERFAMALERQRSDASAPVAEPAPATPAAPVAATAPAFAAEPAQAEPPVFAAAVPETFAPAAAAAPEQPLPWAAPPEPIEHVEVDHDLQLPRALQPLDLESEADEDEDDIAPLSLQLSSADRPFAAPAASEDPYAVQPGHAEDEAEDDGDDAALEDGYSSLLAMKRPFSTSQEFVRIEDEDHDDGATAEAEPVVVFPNQHDRRAAPFGEDTGFAAQGRGTLDPTRPFDAPPTGESALRNGGLGAASPTNPPAARPDPSETERALREALEKLQRMSGAA